MRRMAVWVGLALVAIAAPPARAATNVSILVASSGGDFKDIVVQRVVNHANARRWTVTTVEFGGLTPVAATNQTAVVIVNSVWAWRPAWRVRRFLERLTDDQRRRVVLVNTVQGEGWKYKDPNVHAITAASKPDRVEKVVQFVTGKLDALAAGAAAPGGAPLPTPPATATRPD
jgi:hypothetical protein